MPKPTTALAQAWYRFRTRPRLASNEWAADYWYEHGGERIVPCSKCPKLDARSNRCRVPFGTPLRKCVTAAIEAHLRTTRGLLALEIGPHKRSFAKQVIEQSGGTWTGIEPRAVGAAPRIGRKGYGHAGDIPFPTNTFDLAIAIQSIEHWEELRSVARSPSYRECLAEIWRVLKPGGSLYVDAPIHLHGHEMFVAGDLGRIRALFDDTLWKDVVFERWRYDHAPLPRYAAPEADARGALTTLETYAADAIRDLQRNATVWLLTITAVKRMTAS